MGKVLAYGEITITDLTDGKQIQAYVTSNQPNFVSYDPNTTTKYNPDWSASKLVLTPVIFIDNKQVSLTQTGLSITWQRKVGSAASTNIVTGENVSSGVLSVSKSMLVPNSSEMITYICSIAYTNPDTQIKAETRCQMSFTLVKQATELSDCSITGDTTFKYNGDGAITSASSITLTAVLTNTSVKQWQYKKSDGTFAAYPSAGTTTTLTVNHNDAVFVNDVAVIKLLTNDDNVYDIHQIVKLRDGAAGKDVYSCVLSNDTQSVPCNANGGLYSSSLTGADTTITIYKGGVDDSANWTIKATPSNGITGTWDGDTRKYTVTGITVDSGYVEFVCTKSGQANITKRFSLNKDRSGSDATIYQVTAESNVLKLNASNVLSPAQAKFSAYKRIGNTTAATAYSGRFKISESTDGNTYTVKYTSSSDQTSVDYTPSSTSIKTIKAELYASGGTTTLLDTQTVTIIADGKNGEDGKNGTSAVSTVLGNYSEVIPCNPNGTASAAKDITIPYSCYKGTTRIAGKATVGTLPSGITVKSNTDATASAEGSIILAVASGASLASAMSGDITISIVAAGLTSTHKFNWSKNTKATNGVNAILFQAYAPNGNHIINDSNTVLLQTTLTNGTTTVTSGVTYQWSKYVSGAYQNIASATSANLTVTPSMVDSVASFRCNAVYGGKTYSAYVSVIDQSDPCSINVLSSLGDQLINGQGAGALYVIVTRNGKEIDTLKSTTFSTSAPTKPASGDFYYKVDASAKTVTLMKYNGTAWSAATGNDLPKYTYNWTRRDKKGVELDTASNYASGKAIFLDSSVVNGKMIFGCEVVDDSE